MKTKFVPAKMQTRFRTIGLLLIVLELGSGCGTWAGNPKEPTEEPTTSTEETKVTLDIKSAGESANLIASSFPVIGTSGADIGILALTEARLVLKDIKIKTTESDTSKSKFPGPFIVDLVSNGVTPAIEAATFPAGVYRSIELNMAKMEKDRRPADIDSSDSIVGRSIVLNGSYQPLSGTAKPFSLALEVDEKFKLRLAGDRTGVHLGAGEDNALIIAFHVADWFNFTGSESDLQDVSGQTIALEPDARSEAEKALSEALKENVKNSAEFARDKDRDGKITESDDDEQEIRKAEDQGKDDRKESEK